MPTVSIIIPVYNAAKYLRECLDSVSNQEYKDWECILVNDCSTDNSSEILKEYQEKDNRFNILNNEINSGVSVARYKGLSVATGEWIAFIDSDDIVSNIYLQSMINILNDYTDVDLICCGNFEFEDLKKVVWPNINKENRKISKEEAINMLHYDKKACLNAFWGKLIRKRCLFEFDFEKYRRMFPLCFFEDGFVIPNLLMSVNSIVYLSDQIYAYRLLQSSLSHSTSNALYVINQVKSTMVIYEKYQDYNEDINRKCYEAIMLGIIKAYFCSKKRKEIKEEAVSLFDELYPQNEKYRNINKYTSFNIKLFHLSPLLWCITVGWFYFDVVSKFSFLYKKIRTFR